MAASANWPNGIIQSQVFGNAGPAGFHQMRLRQIAKRYGRSPVELSLINGRLTVTNTMGQPIAGTQLQDGGQELSDGMLRAQVDGWVGIRRDNRELIALDMCRSDESIDAVLWRHSLSLDRSILPGNIHRRVRRRNKPVGYAHLLTWCRRDTIVGP